MRRMLLAQVLVVCLITIVGLGGCLFGKKGEEETAEVEGGPETATSTVDEGAGVPEGPEAPGALPTGPPGAPPAAGPEAPEEPAADAAQAKSLLAQAKQAKAEGNYGKALPLLQQAIAADPGNIDAQWIMGWIYAEQGQTAQALAAFNAFVAAAGGDPRVADAKAAIDRLGAGAPGGGPPGGPPAPAGPMPGG